MSYLITGLVGSVYRTSFLRRDSSALIVESTARSTCLDLSGFLGAVLKTQAERLDLVYLRHWASLENLTDLLDKALNESGFRFKL